MKESDKQVEPFTPVMQFKAEIARLTECLKRANAQAEHFEREWYLRCDEIGALKAERDKQAGESVAMVGETFNLFWTGSEPVADIVMRHNINVGSKLYTQAPAVAVNEQLYQALRHLHHNAKKSGAEMGLALDVAADAIAAAEAEKARGRVNGGKHVPD